MRFNLRIVTALGLEATLEMDQRNLEFRRSVPTVSDVYRFAPELVGFFLRAFGVAQPGHSYRVEVLSLVPHPEFYEGPRDPGWERMLTRIRDESDAMRLADFLEGAHLGYVDTMARIHPCRGRVAAPDLRIDYAFARDVLLERGWEYDRACRIALATVALPGRTSPLGIYRPL